MWVFIPAIPFFAAVCTYAVNIPLLDDYDAVLKTVIDFKKGDWTVIFRQHNEHRLLWERLIYLGDYYLTGSINFKTIILTGDLQLLVVAGVVVYFIRQYAAKYTDLLCFLFCVCLFDLNTYEAAIWTLGSTQVYGVIMLFMLALFFWHKKWVLPAVIAQALCVWSSGNGMVGVGVILVYLIASKNKKHIWICASSLVVSVGLYFTNYTFQEHAKFSVDKAFTYFIRQLGAHFNFEWSFVFGLGMIFFLSKTWWNRKWGRKGWPLDAMLYFSILSMLMTAAFRSSMKDAQYQTSRYLIYPEMIVAIFVVLLVVKLERRKQLIAVTIAACILLYAYSQNYVFGQQGFIRYSERLQFTKYYYPDQPTAAKIVNEARESGIYFNTDQ